MKDTQIDLTGYYIATGKFSKAKEIAVHVTDRKILKRIRNEGTDDLIQEFHGKCTDDVDMFENVIKNRCR